MSDENKRRVEGMTEDERQREISEIYEQLGPGARDIMQKIITTRRNKEGPGDTGVHQPHLPEILAPGALTFSPYDELSRINA
jgi:hypothetical protein